MNYEDIAKDFFAKRSARYGEESGPYNLEFYNKNGRLQTPEEANKYRLDFARKLNAEMSQLMESKKDICIDSLNIFVKHRLRIAEYRQNAYVDSTLLILMNSLYELDVEDAVNFGLDRWQYLKSLLPRHDSSVGISKLDVYSYLKYMLDNLPISQILQILLTNEKVDEDLIDVFINKFSYDYVGTDLNEFEEYIESYLKVNNIENYNEYFVSELKRITN